MPERRLILADAPVSKRSPFAALRAADAPVYLDSAATSLVHDDVAAVVTEALVQGGSAGRGGHRLGLAATETYEGARGTVARHLGTVPGQVVFTASATDGLNLLAAGWGHPHLLPGDALLTTALEHHANVLPWREVARNTGAALRVVGCDAAGDLDLDDLATHLAHGPSVLAVTHVSNVTGATVPLGEVVALVRDRAPACRIVVDGTQAVPHGVPDVEALGVDAYVFSGHKAHGVLGAGVVWAKADLWAEVEPTRWGGGMVEAVGTHDRALADVPWRFEGGTPNHPAVAALAAGLTFCGRDDPGLADAAAAQLEALPGVRVIGRPQVRTGIVAFEVERVHPHDVGAALDDRGIAVRVGTLCAEPYLHALGAGPVVRASFGMHNSADDVERLVGAVADVRRAFP